MAWDFGTGPGFQMETLVEGKVERLGYLGIHPCDVRNERRNAMVGAAEVVA